MMDAGNETKWVSLCETAAVPPGTMRGFHPAGMPPVALFNVDGHFHATSNVCTHNVAILTDGSFAGQVVECPLHGGAFDVVTGEAVAYPCEKGLDTYQVRIEAGRVEIAALALVVSPAAECPLAAQTSPAAENSEKPVSLIRDSKVRIAGSELQFVCESGDTVLRSALRNGIGFPYECNSGGCGTCVFETESGAVRELWAEAPGLSAAARAAGKRLACQAVPTSDLVIRCSPRDEFVPLKRPVRRQVTLEEVIRLTHDMAALRFRADAPADFLPGQYALLTVPGDSAPRAYSMANISNSNGVWEFIVKAVAGGKVSPRLASFKGTPDAVSLDGPYGNAYLRTDSLRDIVCIAGGAGLSPMMSILRAAALDPRFADRKLSLFYGGRTPDDICDAMVLEADPRLRERVVCTNAVSSVEPGSASAWSGPRGFIHEVVGGMVGHELKDKEIYLSGPPPMTDAVQRMLLFDYRVPQSQIHFDRFY